MKRSLSAHDFRLKPLGSPHAAHQRPINHHRRMAHQRHVNHHTLGRSDPLTEIPHMASPKVPSHSQSRPVLLAFRPSALVKCSTSCLISNLMKLGMDMGMITLLSLFLFSTVLMEKIMYICAYVLMHFKTQHISYVIDTIIHTLHHIHKSNWKLSEGWGKITVFHGKIEETATPLSLCMQSWLKHLSFPSRGKGCSLSIISCSTWYGKNTRTDTPDWDELSIFLTVHLIGNQVNLIWCQKTTWLQLLLKPSIPKWGRKLL